MNDVIKIIKSLEDLNVLIDGIIETVKHKKKKKKEDRFFPALLAPLAASRAQPVISKWFNTLLGLLNISITNLDLMAFF